MSNKDIDFSKGVRGKYARTKLEVVGDTEENAVENTFWAICVHQNSKLVERKLYRVQFKNNIEKVSVRDETGKIAAYPRDWFLPVTFDEKVTGKLQELV